VEALNNVLLIGMTNRKDMIDPAILRPGRLELHVEIGLPDERGRVQQLEIHTRQMRENGILAADVNLEELAKLTKNYTGAEMKGLVTKAQSFYNERAIDLSNLEKGPSFEGDKVTRADFIRALPEMNPAFGIKEEEMKDLFKDGIVQFSDEFTELERTLHALAASVLTSETTQFSSALLMGGPSSGKSALAASVAMASGFPYVKRISGTSLINKSSEQEKKDNIVAIFNEAYSSPASLIIIDDIERAMEYVNVGGRLLFSNLVLQALLILVKQRPPSGHRLLVLGTSSSSMKDPFYEMGLSEVFNLTLSVPSVVDQAAYAKTLSSAAPSMPKADVDEASGRLAGIPVGIKKVLDIVAMAMQEVDEGQALTAETFLDCAAQWGVQ